MKASVATLALFCSALAACRGTAPPAPVAREAPPPMIEPELQPGSRLVEARAEELVRQMSQRLATAPAFSLEAEEFYDEVPEHSPRRQLAATRHVSLRRPDRLAGDAVGDALHRAFWYDGKTFAAHDREQNVYASGGVPASIDEALDWVFDQTGTVIPLADFLYADPYARLMGDVQRGVYLGIHEAAGVPCHHLAFEQATIDWQVWIDAGPDPLPRKLVIAYKTEDEVPQVLGDHPQMGLRVPGRRQPLPLHAARRRDERRDRGHGRGSSCVAEHETGDEVMMRAMTAALAATAMVLGSNPVAFAQRSAGGGANRGSVSAASRGTYSKSGNTGTYQGQRASGSRTVTQSGDTYNIDKSLQTQSGASKSVSREVDTGDREVERSSTATNAWGQSATRNREVENQGGYASIEGSAKTSTGRSASAQGVAGINAYGQPAYAGTVNTKYNGNYATAGARNPYGGWTTATAGPYGGKVTTTLPSGYRTSTYYGRPYYTYGGAYYRPYTYAGAHYYYPVPVPYYAYYEAPPVGATMLMVAGVSYLVSKEGSYAKASATSDGKTAYQSVPAPQGAELQVLPAARVLVTVAGTTYYLASNTFYRRVVQGAQERFVVVTAPAGIVFLPALAADFEVVQLNTMYFKAQGQYYVPFMAPDGKELYVMVDAPPLPPAGAAAPSGAGAPQPAATAGAAPTPAPPAATSSPTPGQPQATAIRTVSDSLVVPAGASLVVRLAVDLSSTTARANDRFQGFLDVDLTSGGRLVAPRGTRVYGVVTAAVRGKSVSISVTDVQVGDRVLRITTTPVTAQGKSGDAVVRAQAPQAFVVAAPFQVDIMTNVAVR